MERINSSNLEQQKCIIWKPLLRMADLYEDFAVCYFCLRLFSKIKNYDPISIIEPYIKAFNGVITFVPACFGCYNKALNGEEIERVKLDLNENVVKVRHELITSGLSKDILEPYDTVNTMAYDVRWYEQDFDVYDLAWRLEQYKKTYTFTDLSREKICELIDSGQYNYWEELAKAV